MRLLEQEYGAKLYNRTARGVELTDAGRRFLVAISPILEQVRILKTGNATLRAPDPERLAVGGTHSLSSVLLPLLLSKFKQSRPSMEIDFRTNNATEIERLILKRSVEIALTTRLPKSALVVVEPFRQERVGFVVSRGHPLARARELSLRDIERTPLLVRATGGRDGTTVNQLKNLLEQQGIKVTIGMRFESISALMEAVQRNMGIGVTYEENVRRDEVKFLKLRSLNLEGHSYIAYLNDKPLSKPAIDFLNLLRSARPEKSQPHRNVSKDQNFTSDVPAAATL
jgi:DNA-binding transcriptional LysR family regulator